jgi:hypothetical protein
VKSLLKDAAWGLLLALIVVLLLMFASFNSTFIYRGF